jgi:K(+)-stimulated pyrophosphate-energized sodium pump
MNEISDKIKSGAIAFLKTEYYYLCYYVAVVFSALLVLYSLVPPSGDRTDGIRYACCFLVGSTLSASSGWAGMMVATDANVKTTQAALDKGLPVALRVAFTGGAVMGFTVVGLGLLGLSLMYFFVTFGYGDNTLYQRLNWAADILAGFGFGASSIAIFARVAGGIYTKAADVGADLVGKVEMDIPEDDPRNPAVIADNVGDNVGDVAGMGADLFESYVRCCFKDGFFLHRVTAYLPNRLFTIVLSLQVGSIIAAVTLAGSDTALIMLPFWVAGAGIIASVIGFFAVGTKEGARQRDLMVALHKGVIVSSILVVGFTALIVAFTFQGRADVGWKLFACVVIGLVAGILIGQVTEYFTSYEFWPTRSITKAGVTGPATVVIQGLGIGMISTVFPVVILVATILGCNALSGQYGVALSAVGMLSTLGITLATDAYGPVADNAGGIAEMAELPESVRSTTDALDALGNTTAATGKGFAIGSAVLTALSLLAAFTESAFSKVQDDEIYLKQINIGEPIVLAGVLIGAMLPYLFAALSMLSVQKVRQ